MSNFGLVYFIVAPAGIEPASSESESEILSIEIRSQIKETRPSTRFLKGKNSKKAQGAAETWKRLHEISQ
jgi:hypothetical protein